MRKSLKYDNTIQSVEKVLDIIEILSSESEGLMAKEIARRLKYPLSTVYRFLGTLSKREYVYQNAETNRFSLTTKLLTLSGRLASRSRLGEKSYPHLKELFARCDETVHLAVRDGLEVVYIHSIVSRDLPSTYMLVGGRRRPAYATALGKVLLSALTNEEVRTLVRERGLVRITPNTITEIEDLLAELEETRRRGYAIDNEESGVGRRCVAALVKDDRGRAVAAVSITGPASKINPETYDLYGRMVIETCQKISEDLGYKPSPVLETSSEGLELLSETESSGVVRGSTGGLQ
ncbi:MAG: IclR family transcriptional regulator [bacterium]